MSRRSGSRLVSLFLIAVATLLAIPGSAFAAPPVTDVIDEWFPGQVCSVAVDIHVSGTVTTHIQEWVLDEPGDGWFIGVIKEQLTIEFYSTGGTLLFTNTLNRTLNDVSFEYLGDDYALGPGHYRAVFSYNGMAVNYRVDNQIVIKDTGHLTVAQVLYLGDLEDPDDGDFVSETVLQMFGPHPAYDESAFCTAIMPYLS